MSLPPVVLQVASPVTDPHRRGRVSDPGLRLAQVAYAGLMAAGRVGYVKLSMSGARRVRGVETCWSEPRIAGPLADQIAAVTANAPTGCDLSITLRTPEHPRELGVLDVRIYQAVAQ